jgi:hypothetical protein
MSGRTEAHVNIEAAKGNMENVYNLPFAQSYALLSIAISLARIADALTSQANDVYRCGHGYTGLCLLCARDMELFKPR